MKRIIIGLVVLTLAACTAQASPRQTLDAWAQAALVGDYTTVRALSTDPDLVYGVWQAHHERYQAQLAGYEVLSAVQHGQTTVYNVRFYGTTPARCLPVHVDPAGHISTPRVPTYCNPNEIGDDAPH